MTPNCAGSRLFRTADVNSTTLLFYRNSPCVVIGRNQVRRLSRYSSIETNRQHRTEPLEGDQLPGSTTRRSPIREEAEWRRHCLPRSSPGLNEGKRLSIWCRTTVTRIIPCQCHAHPLTDGKMPNWLPAALTLWGYLPRSTSAMMSLLTSSR